MKITLSLWERAGVRGTGRLGDTPLAVRAPFFDRDLAPVTADFHEPGRITDDGFARAGVGEHLDPTLHTEEAADPAEKHQTVRA